MMQMNQIGLWLQIGANLGILFGLILVGVQISQTAELMRLQLLYQESGRAIENETSIMGETSADVIEKAALDPENLTYAEMRIMEATIGESMNRYEGSMNYESYLVMSGSVR